MVGRQKLGLGLLLALAACNVSPTPGATGGATLATGVAVVNSDYTSTDISLSKIDGTTATASFLSSGAKAPGLSMALSGDVVLPYVAPASGRVVLIDQASGVNALTWANPTTATVIEQLGVGTGFDSDPQDYIEVDSTRAFVSRFATNPTPGQQPFDKGGDLLIVDTTKFTVTGRIAMPEEDSALQPDPAQMNWLGSDVVVTLQRFSQDFTQIGAGRFVGVSPTTNAVAWTVTITGLENCGRFVLSPSGKQGAIACAGLLNPVSNAYDPTASDIVIYDTTTSPPTEVRRLGVAATLGVAVQPNIAFATEELLLGETFGSMPTGAPVVPDTAFAVNAATGAITSLATATQAFVYGGVYCSPSNGGVCLMCDADKNELDRWEVADGGLSPITGATTDQTVGLAPRSLGGIL